MILKIFVASNRLATHEYYFPFLLSGYLFPDRPLYFSRVQDDLWQPPRNGLCHLDAQNILDCKCRILRFVAQLYPDYKQRQRNADLAGHHN